MFSFSSWARPTEAYHSKSYDRISKHHGFEGQGKTVLVTGGASGVGFAICKAFAGAGVARIAIVSRSAEPQKKARDELIAAWPATEVWTYQGSVTDSARMSEILHDLGTVDVLVMGVAAVHQRAKATSITTEDVQTAFDTNVIAAFNLTKAYLETPMPASGSKTVINISSAVAQVSDKLRSAYGASKAAAAQLMQCFAAERESDTVRFFSFHPGTFYTPVVAAHFKRDEIPWDEPELPADFTLWLAGPESSFLNGHFLWAHWDVDELIAMKDRLAERPTLLTIGLVM
ncbi:Short chain dehydrogenase andI [Talaromyces pinophilus]|nr:Short chain dehydrogenase andI [Talaromyces pinophilus]